MIHRGNSNQIETAILEESESHVAERAYSGLTLKKLIIDTAQTMV